jgi:hypothetical protein
MTTPLAELEDHARVQLQWRAAIDAARPHVRAERVLQVSAADPGWTDTGIVLETGQAVSLLSRGVVWLAREFGIGFEGNVGLWHRIGDGPVERAAGTTTSFVAKRGGSLRLAARSPGAWLEASADPNEGGGLDGGLSVAAIVWREGAADGVAALAAADESELAAAELQRLGARQDPPAGWEPHWAIGRSDIFHLGAGPRGGPAIRCQCKRDAGILKFPLDAPLDATTRLDWSWRVQQLPSAVAENMLPTHDYLSIAVEFDNGLDLTYMWSAALPVGTIFQCPLPWWDQRETHWVVRSGTDQAGVWLDEQRGVLEDYRRAIGPDTPTRIVGVWLIAVSAFQRGTGECAYAEIALSQGGQTTTVGP